MQTEMGNAAAVRFGKKEAPVSVAEATDSILTEVCMLGWLDELHCS